MTRDSWLFSWTVSVVGTFAAYLATGPAPSHWDWAHWMQALVTLAGLIGAKLGTSFLQGADDAQKVAVKP